MKVLAVGFAVYAAALFAAGVLAFDLLHPLTALFVASPAAAPDPRDDTTWYAPVTRALAALRPPAPEPAAVATAPLPAPAPAEPVVNGAAGLAAAPATGAGRDAGALAAAPPELASPAGVPPPVTPAMLTVVAPAPAAEPPPPSPVPVVPASATVAAPPADAASAPEIAIMRRRGDGLLALGDLAAARLFYERAAERGDAAALVGLAKSYDPLFLDEAGFRPARGDADAAAGWYRKAIDAGVADAAPRLARLLARTAKP